MKFFCYTLSSPETEPVLRRGAEEFSEKTGRYLALECFQRREDFLRRLREKSPDAAVVAVPGAIGMEAALNAREFRPALPLVWISDDEDFALQSYRMQTQMFLRFPVTDAEVATALMKCI